MDHVDYQIHHRFTNHPPGPQAATRLDELTRIFIDVGTYLADELAEGREKSLAITKLEECSMWSKAAVARNQ